MTALMNDCKVYAVCPHCRDSIVGCTGGDLCPLVAGVKTNGAAMVAPNHASIPSVSKLLPPELLSVFTRAVCEAVSSIASLPVGGTEVDLTGSGYASHHSVVQAVTHGHVTRENAVAELSRRLEAVDTSTDHADADMRKISTAIDLLKTAADVEYSGPAGYGVFTFIWGKCGAYLEAAKSGLVRLPGAAVKTASSVAAELKATIVRPSTQTEFYEMLLIWQMVVHALGLASFLVVAPFIQKTVFDAQTRLQKSWKFAHEFFLVHLRAIETDTSKTLTLANVVAKGNRDYYLMEATANEGTFFRSGGGKLQGDDLNVKWNGKFTKDAKKPCIAFNRGNAHDPKHLHPDGTCKFNHVCMQWVTDKGPRGMCGGDHPMGKCDYDAAKRCDQPAKQ